MKLYHFTSTGHLPGARGVEARLLDDRGLTKALMKRMGPRLKGIRGKIEKGQLEELRGDMVYLRGWMRDLIRMSPEDKEKFGRIKYEILFDEFKRGKRILDGEYIPSSDTVYMRIDIGLPGKAQRVGQWDENKKGYLGAIDDRKIAILLRHELTHALRDAETGHLKLEEKRRRKDESYDKKYQGPRGHLDFEYEVDAIVNSLDDLRGRVRPERWDNMKPEEIEDMAGVAVRFPKVRDPAFGDWVKRLYREGLLTTGMKQEWGLMGKYRGRVAGVVCGMCFRWANMYNAEHHGEDHTLVHGLVTGGPDAKTFPHAWIESGSKVYDEGNPRGVSLHAFYRQLGPEKMKRYDSKEALRIFMKKRQHGPWHNI